MTVATKGPKRTRYPGAMRIALVSPYSWTYQGGVNKHVEALAEQFLDRGDYVRVLAPWDPPDRVSRRLHRLPDLPVRVMAMLVEQGGSQFHLQRFFIEQVDHLRWRDGRSSHQLGGRLAQLASRLNLVGIRIGVPH